MRSTSTSRWNADASLESNCSSSKSAGVVEDDALDEEGCESDVGLSDMVDDGVWCQSPLGTRAFAEQIPPVNHVTSTPKAGVAGYPRPTCSSYQWQVFPVFVNHR